MADTVLAQLAALKLLEDRINPRVNQIVTRSHSEAESGLWRRVVIEPIQGGPAPLIVELLGELSALACAQLD
jgi:hypothetical protein